MGGGFKHDLLCINRHSEFWYCFKHYIIVRLSQRFSVSTQQTHKSSYNNIWVSTWQNKQSELCAQRRLKSAWASAQSDQSLRYALNGKLSTRCFFMRTVKTLIRLSGRLIWVFAGRTTHFVGFVVRRLINKTLMRAHMQYNTDTRVKEIDIVVPVTDCLWKLGVIMRKLFNIKYLPKANLKPQKQNRWRLNFDMKITDLHPYVSLIISINSLSYNTTQLRFQLTIIKSQTYPTHHPESNSQETVLSQPTPDTRRKRKSDTD